MAEKKPAKKKARPKKYKRTPHRGVTIVKRPHGGYEARWMDPATAASYRAADWIGHSLQTAQRHYVGTIRGIPRKATTLEAAMQIQKQVRAILDHASENRHNSDSTPRIQTTPPATRNRASRA